MRQILHKQKITEEYAKEFDNLSKMERMGFDFNVWGISIGGIKFGNIVSGIKKALGMGGSSKHDTVSEYGNEP